MSYIANRDVYFGLIKQLLDGTMPADDFSADLCYWWTHDRDEQYTLRDTWPERYDLQLLSALRSGEIGSEEFSKKMAVLFGYEQDMPLTRMVDSLYTACDAFVGSEGEVTEPKYEYDEKQFIDYVRKVRDEYEQPQTKK